MVWNYHLKNKAMSNIPGLALNEANPGGAWEIIFIDIKLVDTIPLPDTNGIVDAANIALHGDADPPTTFNYLFKTLDSARVAEKEEASDQGPVFKQEVECLVPKDYTHRFKTFTEMEQTEFLVITRDHSGKAKMFGGILPDGEKYGMRFRRNFDSGKKTSDYLGYTMLFYCDSFEAARPVINTPEVAINTDTPVDSSQGGGTLEPPPPPLPD